ncbi:MAG TPA: AmmeMemoRadiSam system radical SAM enzyme [bacterium]|nr:AmmeMemoRadiSam system radical SAM enzyme [bacterium]
MKEALFYEKKAHGDVKCQLCPHHCLIHPHGRGLCRVRENNGGILNSLSYGRLLSSAVDPIEKKPLYHFLPGSAAYSICTAGCNFSCQFCQNADISQVEDEHESNSLLRTLSQEVQPAEIVSLAKKNRCESIAYTYTEPTVFYEYMIDIARLARQAGIRNVLVSNGYIDAEPLAKLMPYLDAANIDLKAFTTEFYQRRCHAKLGPVKETIKRLYDAGVWLEITTLVIPTENDSDAELTRLAKWIAKIDRSIPWHVSAFHPAFKMIDLPPTPISSIHRALEIGKAAGLHYLYAGNVGGDRFHDTICASCQEIVVARQGYTVDVKTTDGICPSCGSAIAGIFT